MNYKICKKCGIEKEATENNFFIARDCQYGIMPTCIICKTGRERYLVRQDSTKPKLSRMDYRKEQKKTLAGFFSDALNNSLRFRNKEKFGLISDLTVEYLIGQWNLQQGKCYWTGIELTYGPADKKQPMLHYLEKTSFDRLDNANGYMIGNVVLCSNFANKARSNMDTEEFKELLKELGIGM